MPSKCVYCLIKINDYSIKCEQCDGIILCTKCFSFGVEAGKHKKCHKYSIQLCSGTKDFALFDASWTAEQDINLLQAVDSCGFGNWNDISNKISKSALDCKLHYESVFLNGYFNSNYSKEIYSDDSSKINCADSNIYPKIPLEHYKKLGFMPKRDDFEFEFQNDAETIISKIRSDFTSDELYRDLVVARIEVFTQCLRERQKRHVVAAKFDLVTHFLHDLLPSHDKVANIARPPFRYRHTPTKQRRRFLFRRSQSRRRYSVIGSFNQFDLTSDQSDVSQTDVTQFKDKLRLVNAASPMRIGKHSVHVPTCSTRLKSESEDVKQLENEKLTDSHTSIVKIPPQPFPDSQVESSSCIHCFVDEKNSVTEENKLSVDFIDSGIGSSECSLHSTTSLNTEGSILPMSNLSAVEFDAPEQTKQILPSFSRRYSHPFISPVRIRSSSFSSVSGVISQTCPPPSMISAVLQTPKSLRRGRYSRVGRPGRVELALKHSNLLPSKCCNLSSISEALKPLLRFLTASEAKLLFSRFHREHVLCQEIEQLQQLQISNNVLSTDNIRLAGNHMTSTDSDSDIEERPSIRPKLKTTPRSLPRASVNTHSLRSSEPPKRGRPRGRPPLHKRGGWIATRGTPKRLNSCT